MEATNQDLMLGLLLSLFAGLSTCIGAAVALFLKRTDTRVLTYALGASAGVMVYISFMELLPEAGRFLQEGSGKWVSIAAFFGGMVLAGAIDRLVPEDENPHEIHTAGDLDAARTTGEFSAQVGVRRSAFLFAAAIAIHNFPEGIATMASAFDNPGTAFSVAFAVAIHNLPEGIAVALPLMFATGSRKRAFWGAALSGLAEPVGALVAMLILLPFLTPTLLAVLFCIVAGFMVYISFDELLPMAERWGHHHLSIGGVISGMLLMALVL